MAGENKRVARYRRKVVTLNKKIDFMTGLIVDRDRQIDDLKKQVEVLLKPIQEENNANQDGETDREGQEIGPDTTDSDGDQE